MARKLPSGATGSLLYSTPMNDAQALMRGHLGDRDVVYVFPSEVAADWTLHDLLDDGDVSALPRDKCISWDRFKEETLAAPEGLRPVDGIARRLFLEALLEENARRPVFRSLIPPEHAAASRAHLPSLRLILPLVGKTERLLARSGAALDPAKRADLALLAARYRAFLREGGLYEPDDARREFVPGRKKYVVFHPGVIADWDDVSPAFRAHRAVRVFAEPADADAPAPLTVHPGLEEEIDALMRSLRGILDADGPDAAAGRIAVTAAGLDELALPLADAARRCDVPLLVNAGRPLASFPGVNVLAQAAAVVGSGFSLRSLEVLLGNRSLPWKDAPAADELLRFGLEHNCVRNFTRDGAPFDVWEHHLARITAADRNARLRSAAGLYRSLRSALGSLAGAADFDEAKKAATKFRAVFFDAERIAEPERRRLELALGRLDELRETARRLPLPAVPSPFRVWLDVLAETRYVPPAREPGIPVYPYRVSAGIRPDRHFVVNVCEEATRVVISTLPFLSVDEQARLGAADRDLSGEFLSLYGRSGKAVAMSCARAGFGRVRLPPPYFVRTGALREEAPPEGSAAAPLSDAYAREERFFLNGESGPPDAVFPLQAAGLAAAAARSGGRTSARFTSAPIPPSDLRRRIVERLSDADGRLVISPTDLEKFTACAFRFLLEKAAGLEERESEFAEDRALWRGAFIHRVFERFFRRLRDGRGRFSPAGRARLREEIAGAADEEARRWEKDEPLPLPPLWRAAVRGMSDGFQAFVDATADAFGDFEILAVEGAFSRPWEEQRLILSGKIDLLCRGEAGLFIIDYKKNRVPSRGALLPDHGGPLSFQIPCYVILAEEGSPKEDGVTRAGERVAAASYYSFERERYCHVLHPAAAAWFAAERTAEVIEGARAALAAMAGRIRDGDFGIDPRTDRPGNRACNNCALRSVCRRKYFLQFEG